MTTAVRPAPPPRRRHRCAAVGCAAVIPARFLMCRPHWHLVPDEIRGRVWAAYRPGQEYDDEPLPTEYADAVRAAVEAVSDHGGRW